MSLKSRITDDMKTAMRARDTARLSAIRLLLAAIKQREVDERIELDDEAVLAVVDKLLKQRRDSLKQFEAAGRADLADIERFEAEVLSSYLPPALSDSEVDAAVTEAIAAAGAKGVADMGRLMATLKGQLAGRTDLGKVSALLRTRLTKA